MYTLEGVSSVTIAFPSILQTSLLLIKSLNKILNKIPMFYL